ncbi:hypothetical protein PanWU01x14_277290 [Parasponia andersonii]|uniref:Transmembrane protein n=1 Tax=Parasponia andersonii TaxID=3476 RepID=A0A2P5B2P2_PARAD|nr:hypothetical protein PanWU01x14_277290 [Parasponia andersonii]
MKRNNDQNVLHGFFNGSSSGVLLHPYLIGGRWPPRPISKKKAAATTIITGIVILFISLFLVVLLLGGSIMDVVSTLENEIY